MNISLKLGNHISWEKSGKDEMIAADINKTVSNVGQSEEGKVILSGGEDDMEMKGQLDGKYKFCVIKLSLNCCSMLTLICHLKFFSFNLGKTERLNLTHCEHSMCALRYPLMLHNHNMKNKLSPSVVMETKVVSTQLEKKSGKMCRDRKGERYEMLTDVYTF